MQIVGGGTAGPQARQTIRDQQPKEHRKPQHGKGNERRRACQVPVRFRLRSFSEALMPGSACSCSNTATVPPTTKPAITTRNTFQRSSSPSSGAVGATGPCSFGLPNPPESLGDCAHTPQIAVVSRRLRTIAPLSSDQQPGQLGLPRSSRGRRCCPESAPPSLPPRPARRRRHNRRAEDIRLGGLPVRGSRYGGCHRRPAASAENLGRM